MSHTKLYESDPPTERTVSTVKNFLAHHKVSLVCAEGSQLKSQPHLTAAEETKPASVSKPDQPTSLTSSLAVKSGETAKLCNELLISGVVLSLKKGAMICKNEIQTGDLFLTDGLNR